MPRKLLKYAPPINRATFQVKHNWFPKSFYSDDNANFVPEPIACCSVNSGIIFQSPNYFTCIVDYGDGYTAQYSAGLVGSSYTIVLKSLVFDGYKKPGSHWKGAGETVAEPHHYEDDDKSVMRTVIVTFSNPITYISANTIVLNAFPILESASLNTIVVSENKYIPDIPYESLSRVPNLTYISIKSTGSRIVGFPKSFWDKTQLETLAMEHSLDCFDIESSGIRNVRNFKNLTDLNMSSNYIPTYLKEYNELPNLRALAWYVGPLKNKIPDIDWSLYPSMDEVNEYHPNLGGINVVSYRDSGRDKFPVLRRGINWNKAYGFSCSSVGSLENRYPDWLYDVRNLKQLSRVNSVALTNISKQDDIVNEFYDFVTGWEYITMSEVASDGNRNQFYGVILGLVDNVNYPDRDPRPSGVYQAPEGFVKGSANGNPATPMEKIYVLVNNYNMVINVREEADSAAARARSNVEAEPAFFVAMRDNVAYIASGEMCIANSTETFTADTEEEVMTRLDEMGGVSTNLWLSDTSKRKLPQKSQISEYNLRRA